jgi:nitrite transporter NirC
MVEQTIKDLATAARKKASFGLKNPLHYFTLSMMAGVYVGFGIILIFSIGGPLKALDAPIIKTVMGASFGIALTLVIFAGSELFTGNTMILTIGSLAKEVRWRQTLWLWLLCLVGNFAGSVLLAWAFVASGLGSQAITAQFITDVAIAKSTAPFLELFIRGILCNMLVCLAVWTSSRTKNDSAKILLIFWCLFAFIGSGFEHSIANMTLLAVPVFLPGADSIKALGNMFSNLLPVTLGNMIGGALCIGAAYWYIATPVKDETAIAIVKGSLKNEEIVKNT